MDWPILEALLGGHRMPVFALLVGSMLAASSAPLAPSAVPRAPSARWTRVVVNRLTTEGGVPDRVAHFTARALVQELRKLERIQVTSAEEIDELLSFEEQKRLAGCSEEVCLTEIANALGAEQIVTGTLVATANSHVLRLARIDVTRARTLGSVNRTLEKKDGEEFLSVLGAAVEELLPEAPLRPGMQRGVSQELARRLNPPPLPRWSALTVGSAAVAAAGAGGVMGLLMKESERQYNTLAGREGDIPGAQLSELERLAKQRADWANRLFAGAGALAVTAGVMALFVDWSGGPEEGPRGSVGPVQVSVLPAQGGVMAGLTLALP